MISFRPSALPCLILCALLFLCAHSDRVAAADSFANFIIGLRSICAQPPSTNCVGAISAFLDSDASGRVELRELDQANNQALLALRKSSSGLNPQERNLIAIGAMVMKFAGLAEVFANFDTNGDGGLDNSELFADFTIDQRSFGAIVKDPKGVNWKSFVQRFGKVGPLINNLLPPSRSK